MGLQVDGPGATLRVANSTVSGNTKGWVRQNTGVLQSYGDNYIDGDGPNTGPLVPNSKRLDRAIAVELARAAQ